MKLVSAQVWDYKSIWDSNRFEVGDITCLVGKNEAGKTALLQALYKLNPIIPTESEFDITNDYPRAEVSDYEEQVADGDRKPAKAVEGIFELDNRDVSIIAKTFGQEALSSNELKITRYYKNPEDPSFSTKYFKLIVNISAAFKYVFENAKLTAEQKEELSSQEDEVDTILEALHGYEATEEVNRLIQLFSEIQTNSLDTYIYSNLLKSRIPKFLYFDEYYQMKGHENLEALRQRQISDTLTEYFINS